MERPKIIVFDVNETLLDLTPLKVSVAEALGGRPDLASLWFTTLLQYSLVATVADRDQHFDEIGVACLQMIAEGQGIRLDHHTARRCLALMRALPPHPEVTSALERLRDDGYRLATLTNSSRAVLADQMTHADLERFFEAMLSVEEIGRFKPHPHVYRWAARRLGVEVSECLLVAAHGWDVAGASWVGMRTAFVARPGQSLYPLGPAVDATVPSFADLPEMVARLVSSSRAERGEPVLLKKILDPQEHPPETSGRVIDLAAEAAVRVTSEDPEHPIDHAFDDSEGPGGSRWIAGTPGEQTLILAFDAPQGITRVALEVEERNVARTQDLQLALSTDGGQTYREVLRQEYGFSPTGSTFEREDWEVRADRVTHLRLVIRPDKGGRPCRASITTLALRG
ncbi:haloacid dehalogenase type II [Tautonia rosea]|uniref:haloacid dehalogenase type II n=1 Tax=Tautonia rosea TaxID=2728037 RepID=UPI001473080C|nr:haloacid dehalogenase type II [Tautonia rosea]